MEIKRIKIQDVDHTCSTRLSNFLHRFEYLDQFSDITADEVLRQRNVGRYMLRELRKFLAFYGISLKGDIIFDSEGEKKLLQDVPNQIKEISHLLIEIDRRVRCLSNRLDELHCNIQPLKPHEFYG